MAVKKAKAKQWFTLIAPKMFWEKEIGNTLTFTPENLIGKKVSLSAVDLTNDIGKYYFKLNFKITKIDGDKAFTEFSGSECMQDYLSRMVIRHVRRIDTVQDLTTKDGVKITVKTLATISKRATSSVEVKFREFLADLVKKIVEDMTLEELVKKMLSNDIRARVLKEGRRIYPVRNFEIRRTEIIK